MLDFEDQQGLLLAIEGLYIGQPVKYQTMPPNSLKVFWQTPVDRVCWKTSPRSKGGHG